MVLLVCAWTNCCNKQPRRRWFETAPSSLWRHCNRAQPGKWSLWDILVILNDRTAYQLQIDGWDKLETPFLSSRLFHIRLRKKSYITWYLRKSDLDFTGGVLFGVGRQFSCSCWGPDNNGREGREPGQPEGRAVWWSAQRSGVSKGLSGRK